MSGLLCSLFLLFWFCSVCDSWEILHFHDNCGSTISEEAGELRFDAQSMPTYLPQSKCRVTIDTETSSLFSVTKTKVLFYFTKIALSSSCADVNVTAEDGALYSGNKIKGLPFYICGTHKSLEQSDQMFTTNSNKLTLTVRKYSYGTSIPGTFIMKYIKVYADDCDENGRYLCSNGYCIPSEYHCSDDIKPCGTENDYECGFLETIGNAIQAVIEKYSWIIIVVVALCFLKVFVKTNRTANRVVTSAWSSIENVFKRENATVCQLPDSGTADEHRDQHPRETEDVPRERDIPHLSDTYDTTSIQADDITGNSRGMGNTPAMYNTPSAPPPSYEEVMSSSYRDNTTDQNTGLNE